MRLPKVQCRIVIIYRYEGENDSAENLSFGDV